MAPCVTIFMDLRSSGLECVVFCPIDVLRPFACIRVLSVSNVGYDDFPATFVAGRNKIK